MRRDELAKLLEPLDSEPRGMFDVRVTVGNRVMDIDSRYVNVYAPLVSALMLQSKGRVPKLADNPAKSANPASPDFHVEEEPPFTAALASESESGRIPASAGTSAPPKAPEVDMGRAEEELDVPSFLRERQTTGAVRPHTVTEGW